MSEVQLPISDAYAARLVADYGGDIAGVVSDDWRVAQLPEQPGEQIAYIRLGAVSADPSARQLLFVHGFSGGIVANAPFGAAMAHRGFDIIIPDQNRVGIPHKDGRVDATYGQARNLAAIIEAEGLTETSLNIITHSYGSLILDELTQYAANQGWSCFDGAKVAMLAPAGIKRYEHPLSFLYRYGALMRAGGKLEKFPDSYWEFGDEMFGSGTGFVKANLRRAFHEGLEIMTRRVDLSGLVDRHIGQIALVPFAEDRLYSSRMLGRSIASIMRREGSDGNITAFSPYSSEEHILGLRGGRGADHSDQQFNPERVANAVALFLHG